MRVLIDGFDGHVYRMIHYWKDKFPDLDFDNLTVEVVNALKKPWDSLRSDSKPVSFALQYQGTWTTLCKNCGFSEEEGKAIEANFKELYSVSVAWTMQRLQQASKDGYVTLAYGLRLRTPLLERVIINSKHTPRDAAGEARTAGNALSGQSYGLCNTVAANRFMKRVRASKYKYDIKLSAQIHDAIYPLFRNRLEIVEWVNINLVECMRSVVDDELPELHHPSVSLNAELDLFPDWSKAVTLPNLATQEEIWELATAS